MILLTIRGVSQDKNNPSGLEGPGRRFLQFNGGASDTQLEWLRATLADVAAQGQRAIVCCHVALHPGASTVSIARGMQQLPLSLLL